MVQVSVGGRKRGVEKTGAPPRKTTAQTGSPQWLLLLLRCTQVGEYLFKLFIGEILHL